MNLRSLGGAGLLFTLLAHPPDAVAEPVSLQLKWPVGQRLVYQTDIEQDSTISAPGQPQPIKQRAEMSQEFSVSVTRQLEAGDREVVLEFLSQKMAMTMNGQKVIEFDSKLPQTSPNPAADAFTKMIGAKISYVVGPDGRVKEVRGFDEMFKAIGGDDPQMQETVKGMFNPEQLKQLVDASSFFPEKPVEVGESWQEEMKIPAGPMGDLKIRTTSTLVQVTERDAAKVAEIDTVADFSSAKTAIDLPGGDKMSMQITDGEQTGKMFFNLALGAIRESTMRQNFKIRMSVPIPETAEKDMVMEMAQKITMKLVEVGKISQ